MTLTQLRHFIHLAHSGSFSRSAVHLHITQPALSRSIKALEDELGQRLFDRVGRRIEITSFGQQLLEHARSLVDLADTLRQSTQQARAGLRGRLRIGLGSGPGALLTTPLLLRMAETSPEVQLHISRGNTELLVQSLRDRTLDALVVDIRALQPAPDLQVEALPEMGAGFLVRPGHPLLKGRSVRLAQLRPYRVASTPLSDEVARALVERYGAQAHPEQMVTLRCDEISHLAEVARQSDAVLLAVRAAAPDLQALPMQPKLTATARYGIVTVATRSASPLLASLRQQVHAILNTGVQAL